MNCECICKNVLCMDCAPTVETVGYVYILCFLIFVSWPLRGKLKTNSLELILAEDCCQKEKYQ